MLNFEIAELMNDTGKMYELAEKTHYKLALNAEEKEAVELCDAWARDLADKGDPNKELAAYMRRTIQEEIYNAPDELLDRLFDRGSVGEFDDYEVSTTPKNTLQAHDAAKGGTVDASYLDIKSIKPAWKNKQVEFEISYADMRKNGWKTVAMHTTLAQEALMNLLFADVFGEADNAISGGDQLITETSAMPTIASIDALTLYLNDRNNVDSVIVTLTKYAQAIARMPGYSEFMSGNMKDDFNRYGLVKFVQGVNIAGISGAKKMANGNLLIPDKRIFGIADKIGTLDMKGDIHVYEDMDNANEVIRVRVKDFTYGYAITDISKVAKIVLA